MQHTHDDTFAVGALAQPQAKSRRQALLHTYSPFIALLAAWIAMCGSLFFSEVLGYIPCTLCWYQRILMYPLTLILSVGILRRDEGIVQYVLPLSLPGALVSLYHYLLIKTDIFPPPACTNGIPCTVDYIDWLGFINIPFMALTAFIIISAMMFVFARNAPSEDELYEPDEDAEAEAPTSGLDYSFIGVIAVVVGVPLAFVVLAMLI